MVLQLINSYKFAAASYARASSVNRYVERVLIDGSSLTHAPAKKRVVIIGLTELDQT